MVSMVSVVAEVWVEPSLPPGPVPGQTSATTETIETIVEAPEQPEFFPGFGPSVQKPGKTYGCSDYLGVRIKAWAVFKGF